MYLKILILQVLFLQAFKYDFRFKNVKVSRELFFIIYVRADFCIFENYFIWCAG